jgi:CHAT domain-containing protein/tetratricopeptide (TPR) repeat protein
MNRVHSLGFRLLSAASFVALAMPVWSAETPISNRNAFRIGDSGVLCSAQSQPTDKRLSGLFDRAYALSCRDASGAVGSLIAVRRDVDLAREPSMLKAGALTCAAEASETIDGLGPVRMMSCRDEAAHLDYRRYAVTRGKTSYLVEGLAGYDPALRLALASVVTDRPVAGTIRVATTEVSDSAAFARIQAGLLDPASARAEAYARNNGGQFAEAEQFFQSIAERNTDNSNAAAEALANQGLQQSNLSNFDAAERLFAAAEARAPASDGVIQRMIRNFRAINALNQRQPAAALEALQRTVPDVAVSENEELRQGLINIPLADGINRDSGSYQQVSSAGSGLRPAERAELLDGQAEQLAGIALRQAGRFDEASARLSAAQAKISGVRNGKLPSAAWLLADITVEQAQVAEASGSGGSAGGAYDSAIAILEQNFPESPMLLATRARKAGFLARQGNAAEARTLFANVVDQSAVVADSGTALRDLLAPYFDMLAGDGSAEAADAMFRASQALQRPGVARTQAVLARQFSEGDDEGAALFRLAVARTREIARTEAEIATLNAIKTPSPRNLEDLASARSSLEAMRTEQVALQSKLVDYPRYKVLAPSQTALAELRGALKPGEAYYKMMGVGDRFYAIFATQAGARAMRMTPTRNMVADDVSQVRNSIVRFENGEQVVDPFDVARARKLYLDLFGPVDSEMADVRHLIFEPDGAMLQLPPYLLIARQAGLDAYQARQARPGADPFDLRGIDWLGKGRDVSISVSPRGFLDVRALAPSTAREAYLGLGNNAPVAIKPTAAVADECDWPVAIWQQPISPAELVLAQSKFGPQNADLMTGASFSDTAMLAQGDLDKYRILHFATHGLVTAPRRGCPARPALVTSFGGQGSDGLLSFGEIFDLKLNADIVILSACDTAGGASANVSREAGVLTGGNYALDGMVRAFVGAGARSVVASHWPVPDDFNATQRLISGLIDAQPGQSVADALSKAQGRLMDDANTSHPFYWAAFIILGDGAKSMVTPQMATAGGSGTTAGR